jgi:hypothetical protein
METNRRVIRNYPGDLSATLLIDVGVAIRKTWREHAGHSGWVLNMLQRHPFVGLSPEGAAGRIVFELADSALGDSGTGC